MSKNKKTEYRVQNTENKVQSTDSFESQLSASARRLRKQSEKNISTPAMMVVPQKRTRYWGWIATPAAAAVGLLIGLFFSQFTQTTSFVQRQAGGADNNDIPVVVAAEMSGHSIADDGADYSLLVQL